MLCLNTQHCSINTTHCCHAQVTDCTDPAVAAASCTLWPRTWTALLSCAASLHQPEAAARLLHLLLQRELLQQPEGRESHTSGVFANAVRLCSSTGVLSCCPGVVLTLWAFVQQQLSAGQDVLRGCGDSLLMEVVLATIRAAGQAPDLTGTWPPLA